MIKKIIDGIFWFFIAAKAFGGFASLLCIRTLIWKITRRVTLEL